MYPLGAFRMSMMSLEGLGGTAKAVTTSGGGLSGRMVANRDHPPHCQDESAKGPRFELGRRGLDDIGGEQHGLVTA